MGQSPAGVVQDMSSASLWARPQQDKALRSPELPMPKPGPHRRVPGRALYCPSLPKLLSSASAVCRRSLEKRFINLDILFLLGPLKYDLGRFAV